MGAQRLLALPKLIEGPVEPVVIDQAGVHSKQIIQRGGVIPMPGHAQFGALRA